MILIDGVIFQLQAGNPLGISRIWQHLIHELSFILPKDQVKVLRRKGYPTLQEDFEEIEIPAYNMNDLDGDDKMLLDNCNYHNADLFISTYYTRALGIKNLLMIYDCIPEVMKMDLSSPEWAAKKRAIETASHFIVISKNTWKDLRDIYNVMPKNMTVAYPGVDKELHPASKKEIRTFKEKYHITKPYFLMMGRQGGYKNGKAFLDTLDKLDDKNDYQVVIAGHTDINMVGGNSTYILNIPHNSPDLRAAYSGAFALAYPSLYEGFGMPVLEAMATGCPVIANEKRSSIHGFAEDIPYYINHEKPQELRGAIDKIAQNDEEQTKMSIEKSKQFTWKRMANIMTEVIKNMTQKEPEKVQNGSPLITAIVSTYNSFEFIEECIQDLEDQTIADKMEIIIVDSGSKEEEDGIIKFYQGLYKNIFYIRTPERETIYKAWNRAIVQSKGKYLTNCNTDDRHSTDFMERMVKILEDDKEIGVVYADSLVTDEKNGIIDTSSINGRFCWPEFDRRELFNNSILGPQPMWRKSLHSKYGLFDESLIVAGDYEFWLRISDKTRFHHIDEPLGLYLLSLDSVEHKNSQVCQRESEMVRNKYWDYKEARIYNGKSYLKPEERRIVIEEDTDPNLVSVIVPTYNRPDMLRHCLKSIIDQTYRPIEIIVINDNGIDVSDVIKEFDFNIKYISHSINMGTGKSRNDGVYAAKGKFIAFLDDDDIYYNNHIQTLIEHYDPKYSVIYTDSKQVQLQEGNNGEIIEKEKKVAYSIDFNYDKLMLENYIPNLCVLTTKKVFMRTRGFDRKMIALEDWEWLIKCALVGEFLHVKLTTSQYYVNIDKATRNRLPRKEIAKLYKMVYAKYAPYCSDQLLKTQDEYYSKFIGDPFGLKDMSDNKWKERLELSRSRL